MSTGDEHDPEMTRYLAKLENRVKLLTARKEILFLRVQNAYDMGSKIKNDGSVADNKAKKSFKISCATLDDTKKQFEQILEEINMYQIELGQDPDFSSLNAFDTIFCHSKDIFTQIQTEENKASAATSISSPNQTNTSTLTPAKPELPPLDIPKFDGKELNWIFFYRSFKSIILNNNDLDNDQKVRFLSGALQDKALALVSGINPIGENFQLMWDTLRNRYADPRVQATNFLNTIINYKPQTKESVSSIDNFMQVFLSHAQAFLNLNLKDPANFILYHLASSRLPASTIRQFELSNVDKINIDAPSTSTTQQTDKHIPGFKELSSFLQGYIKVLSHSSSASNQSDSYNTHNNNSRLKPKTGILENKTSSSTLSRNTSNARNFNTPRSSKTTQAYIAKQHSGTSTKCPVCSKSFHQVYLCDLFKSLNLKDKLNAVKTHNLCSCCLSFYHTATACKSNKSCSSCQGKHHTLICENFKDNSSISSASACQDSTSIAVVAAPPSSSPLTLTNSSISTVLLQTALVIVYDINKKPHVCRALLDSAAQSNTVSQALRKKLGLQTHPVLINVQGIGGHITTVTEETSIIFASRFDKAAEYKLSALVMDQVTDVLPSYNIYFNNLTHLQGLQLADETYHTSSKVDLLIGASHYAMLLGPGKVTGPPNTPYAVQTTLGYVVSGPIGEPHPPKTSETLSTLSFASTLKSYCLITSQKLDTLVSRMWELEDFPQTCEISLEEDECEKIFSLKTKRTPEGRYSVDLPFSEDPSLLGNSKDIALRRFYSLEKRLEADPQLRIEYNNFMEDYVRQGHMTLGEDSSDGCYLPHHCVLKPDSTSTKLRVVWDASCKTSSGYSLNDVLHTGPKLHQDLQYILINFRLFSITMTADVRQMYRQILINKDHRKFQKIFWRFSKNEKISVYTLTTVTFGIKPAPYLALKVLRELARNSKDSFPLAASIIEKSFYVDDLGHSVPDISEALHAQTQLVSMLKTAGFNLVKWSSNSLEFLNAIPPDIRLNQNIDFDSSDTTKILGLQFNPSIDSFVFIVKNGNLECSKRNILSTYARIFDPLGFLAPVTVNLKILIKEFWNAGLDWDAIPSCSKLTSTWSKIQSQLPLLSELKIPRFIGLENRSSEIDLVGFADASGKAYGAVVYTRVRTANNIQVSLLCAKSRVSPQKAITIPRLELCAAVLLSRLLNFLKTTLHNEVNINRIFAFSDSAVVLSWIDSSPSRWKVFVSNRVQQIKELAPNAEWRHVAGISNPADCLSRGMTPKTFLSHLLWFNGPDWIELDPTEWPTYAASSGGEENAEERKLNHVTTQIEVHPYDPLILNCSSYTSILKSIAFINRWKIYKRSSPPPPFVTSREFDKAEILLLKYVQHKHFYKEIAALENNERLSPRFRKLTPFKDPNGLIVVGGRLAHANLSYQQQHPVLLPKDSRIVRLLIYNYHANHHHTGSTTTLALLRQKYWIFGGRDVVRKIIGTCNICFRHRPRSPYPLMGELPKERVTMCKPFLNTGVDYAGPYDIVFSKKRGIRTHKAYLCLFICLATKAVHLELASDLSTPTFLNALKRFISRRGPVRTFYSDGGTNFIGARNHLNQIYDLLTSPEYIKSYGEELAANRITWSQIVPSAPHMGGAWESNIKSAKSLIAKTIGQQVLTYEELTTVFIQVEALLNSRPLCVLSSDPHDLKALTPADFLHQHSLDHFPSPNLEEVPINRLTRYQLLERITQDFWKRWHIEYLNTLQSRQKWNTPSNPVTVGTIVLIRKENCPPLQWPLGVIEAVHPGQDGVVRVASVRSRGHLYRRPVVKLCPLPTQ